MGSANRAARWTDWICDRGLRAIAHYSLDKCGNCPRRLVCVEGILTSHAPGNVGDIIADVRATCKHRGHRTNQAGRYVAAHVERYCRTCDKRTVCIEEACHYFHINQDMKPCLDCPDLANCVSGLLADVKLGYPHLIRACLTTYRKCKAGDFGGTIAFKKRCGK